MTDFKADECREAMFSGKLVCSGKIQSMTVDVDWDWYIGADRAALYVNGAFILELTDMNVITTEGMIEVCTCDNSQTLVRINVPVGSLDGVRI